MILRCTAKILALLGARPAELATPPASDDDWYLNLLWIERRKCLLLAHAGTLFPVFAADVRKAAITPIGPYVVSLIEKHLSFAHHLQKASKPIVTTRKEARPQSTQE